MSAVKTYLVAYNATLFLAWCGVVVQLVRGSVLHHGELSLGAEVAFPLVKACVAVAWVEVLHTALGLTKGSVPAAFVQSLGRFGSTFWICRKVPEVMSLELPFFLFLVWALIELVRYPYYLLTLLGKCPRWLEWLRYSAFVPLYPIGMALEWFAYRVALPYVKIRGFYSVHMPNRLNFEFSFYYFCCVVLFLYLAVGPFQYRYMLKQRQRRLQKVSKKLE
mmetsp:Transcript_6572/g.19925  ORF Transcript_6572/g.19925 Transcript_6572/m.19925 type:complete len:220 (-) Transcript_6572:1100-1759(-)|eukprot:CAMPEP_0198729750 /NCGR_PEP_ID=MMETSP1475-20131203/20807_1 /TAXON_ID= ORGANISM="Unidentified sp., Strain CCMP1999" /NCGR_SAMPLE_ID=MMETSP1475 /ASSEMBLY_ACC=CAM_ASM_001111 /LENGTH=219 /DNA_ID=CAMNT_0044492451 /DNA_START=60 /DNA_END=719 /DNA_ORIENTATION=-